MTKILIIDDDKGLRQLFGKRLERAGYDVVYAGDGIQGLLQIAEESPSLILLDLNMPNMSGDEMLAELRSLNCNHKDIPVIVMTAALSPFNVPNIDQANEVLSKPVSTRELVTTVSQHLKHAYS